MSQLQRPGYRPDIDGLRGLAVLAVVGFHAFPQVVPGGFVGVDVFFVVSGFLINTLIFRGLEASGFSLRTFYARRIRRLFPALALVLLACLLAGWVILLADELESLGLHVAAGAGFVSNLLLASEAGYFDRAAATKPLLHLWSLGVEEQFYIVWPLLVILSWKQHRRLLVVTLLVAALSFLLDVGTVRAYPSIAFYSPLHRFWELMLGGVLAHDALHARRLTVKRPGWLSLGGIAAVCASVALIDENVPYPGWATLAPTLGTALVIAGGPAAWPNRNILARRALLWVGLISYPLYLWHWPLLSFARIVDERMPDAKIRLIAIAISVLLAWGTYRLVERPVRYGPHPRTSTTLAALAILLLGTLGYVTYRHGGFPSRAWLAPYQDLAHQLDYKSHFDQWAICPGEERGESYGCRILDPSRPETIAVIGDSHAGHLASGLAALYGGTRENVSIRLSGGCMPFLPVEWNRMRYFTCGNDFIGRAIEKAIASDTVHAVILTGYANAHIYLDRGYDPHLPEVDRYVSHTPRDVVEANTAAFDAAMTRTLDRLVRSGKQVVFIADVPELYFDPRECVSLRPFRLSTSEVRQSCTIDRELFHERNAPFRAILKHARARFPSVTFIRAWRYFCEAGTCDAMRDEELLYGSRDHLTPVGSRYLFDRIAGKLP